MGQVTIDVIHEFASDNVKYLELRSTPRGNIESGMTKRDYIEAVIEAIQKCNADSQLDIQVRYVRKVLCLLFEHVVYDHSHDKTFGLHS